MTGHKIDFRKYYTAKMVEYTLPGRKGYWDRSLMDAFKAGVTDYVCGNAVDIAEWKVRCPSTFWST